MTRDEIRDEFWGYCKTHAYVLSHANSHPLRKTTFETAETMLRRYDEGLGLEILSSPESSSTILVITAYCDVGRRDAVRNLMDNKPDLDGLAVRAFRPPSHEKFEIEIAGFEVCTDDMHFEPLLSDNDSNALGLEIHFRNGLILPMEVAEVVAMLAVSAMVGEEAVMNEIAVVRPIVGGAQPFTEFVPMEMLPRLLEWHRARRGSLQ
jgi:hypothetical protein